MRDDGELQKLRILVKARAGLVDRPTIYYTEHYWLHHGELSSLPVRSGLAQGLGAITTFPLRASSSPTTTGMACFRALQGTSSNVPPLRPAS
jgi:hypothetical protein